MSEFGEVEENTGTVTDAVTQQAVQTDAVTQQAIQTDTQEKSLENQRLEAAMELQKQLLEKFPNEALKFGSVGEEFVIMKTPVVDEEPNLDPEKYGTIEHKVERHLISTPYGARILDMISYPKGELSSYEYSEDRLQKEIFPKGKTFRPAHESLTLTSSIPMSESPYYKKLADNRELLSLGSVDPSHSMQVLLGDESSSYFRLRQATRQEVQSLVDAAKESSHMVEFEQASIQQDLDALTGIDLEPIKK